MVSSLVELLDRSIAPIRISLDASTCQAGTVPTARYIVSRSSIKACLKLTFDSAMGRRS